MSNRSAELTLAAKPGRGRIYDSITETIGDTPLVRLDRLAHEKGVKANLLAKLEFFNPIASVKDRIGVAMIEALEAAGQDHARQDHADRADLRQYRHRARLRRRGARLSADPDHAGNDVDRAAQDAGAARRRTRADRRRRKGMKGAIAKAEELVARHSRRRHPAAVREPGQSGNPPPDDGRGNLERHQWRGRHLRLRRRHRRHHHRRRPGPEAAQARLEDHRGRAGGFARCSPAAQPGPHKIQGIGAGFVPPILDRDVYRRGRHGRQSTTAFDTARLVARLEGIPVGISSGAAIAAALEVGARPETQARTSSSSSRPSPSAICRPRCSKGCEGNMLDS